MRRHTSFTLRETYYEEQASVWKSSNMQLSLKLYTQSIAEVIMLLQTVFSNLYILARLACVYF